MAEEGRAHEVSRCGATGRSEAGSQGGAGTQGKPRQARVAKKHWPG